MAKGRSLKRLQKILAVKIKYNQNMKRIKQKIKEMQNQCSLCAANFEVWLNNSRLSDERREKISEKLLSYCPACKVGQ